MPKFQAYDAVIPASDDIILVLDVSDKTDSAAGTTKKVIFKDLPVSSAVQDALDLKLDAEFASVIADSLADAEVAANKSASVEEDKSSDTKYPSVKSLYDWVVKRTTKDISEQTNLYFTEARAIAAALTGFVAGTGIVLETDSLLQAIQKLVGNLDAWRVIAGGTKGQVLTKASDTDNDVAWSTVVSSKFYQFIEITKQITGILPLLVTEFVLPAGTYSQFNAVLGTGNLSTTAILQIRTMDGTAIKTLTRTGVPTAVSTSGFTLDGDTLVGFYLYSDTATSTAFIFSLGVN